MRNIIYYFCFFLLLQANAYAQGESNVWAFGTYAGIKFTSSGPVAINSAMTAIEGSASICDANGNLLFYTEGSYVWDRTGTIMANANNLTGIISTGGYSSATLSTTEGTVIVPMIDSPGKYYIFSLSAQFPSSSIPSDHGKLFYSVVDMSLNNGLGDVIPGRKGIFIDSNLTEKMTATAGANCDVWLVVHSDTTNAFYSYEITNRGFNMKPVKSVAGAFNPPPNLQGYYWGWYPYDLGNMKFSPDGKRLATGNTQDGYGIELYDFDLATGIVSNDMLIDSGSAYGVCFSPDGSKLYTTYSGLGSTVDQFDVSLPTQAAIITSKKSVVINEPALGDLKIGPDGKIYFLSYDYGTTGTWLPTLGVGDPHFLNVINFPNLPGAACQPVMNAVPLAPGTDVYGDLDLPNVNIVTHVKDTIHRVIDTMVCIPKLTLQADTSEGQYNYMWSDGLTTSNRKINNFGTYTVTYHSQCTLFIDTFHVLQHSFGYVAMGGSTNCFGQYKAWASLPANSSDTFAFKWINAAGNIVHQVQGSISDTATGLDTGTYNVQIQTPSGCDTTLQIRLLPSAPPVTGGFGGCAPGSGNSQALVWIIPADDEQAYTYQWSDQEGDQLGTRTSSNGDTLAVTKLGTYTVAVSGQNNCDVMFNITTPAADPGPVLTNVTPDQIIKQGASLQFNAAGAAQYVWTPTDGLNNPDIADPIATLIDTITYIVTGTDNWGCSSTAVVYIDIDFTPPFIPDAFTPNGDGKNDVFRIVNAQHQQLLDFRIFNRWGQLVFSTLDINQGWDGTWKGVSQEMDTYNYMAKLRAPDGKEHFYKGTVTLIR